MEKLQYNLEDVPVIETSIHFKERTPEEWIEIIKNDNPDGIGIDITNKWDVQLTLSELIITIKTLIIE